MKSLNFNDFLVLLIICVYQFTGCSPGKVPQQEIDKKQAFHLRDTNTESVVFPDLAEGSAWQLSTDSVMNQADFYKGGWGVTQNGLWTYKHTKCSPPLIMQSFFFNRKNRLKSYKYTYNAGVLDSLKESYIQRFGPPKISVSETLFIWNTKLSEIRLEGKIDRAILAWTKR